MSNSHKAVREPVLNRSAGGGGGGRILSRSATHAHLAVSSGGMELSLVALPQSLPPHLLCDEGWMGSAPALPLSMGSLSPIIMCKLQSLAVNVVHLASESLAMEHFWSFGLEAQLGRCILDLFLERIHERRAPKLTDDSHDDYVKGLDNILAMASVHPYIVVAVMDGLAPKGAFQSVAVALLF